MRKLLIFLAFLSQYVIAQVPASKTQTTNSVKLTRTASAYSVKAVITISNNDQPNLINGIFNLTIPSGSTRMSIGVYDSNGVLVRTIASGIDVTGLLSYQGQWDGYLDDLTTVAPLGTYTVKALYNNVQYDWLGVIGNSSTSHLQNEFLIGNGIAGLAATNDYVYICSGYAERDITTNKFKSSDIGSMYHVIPGSQSLAALTSCTNSKYVFYGGNDFYGTTNKGVFVIDPATDEEIIFDNGRAYNIAIDGRLYKSMLGFADDSNPGDAGRLTSVSASDDFLFIAYQGGNLKVVDLRNKSGAVLSITNIPGLGRLAYGNGKLWVIVNGMPKCYSVSSSGTLTDDNLTISNVSADNLAYNAFKNELVLSDVTTQTYKFYDNNSGNYKSVLGQSGGYLTNGPAVTNDKFCFIGSRGDRDVLHVSNTAFTFLPNGTFWIADNGNYRMLHFDANHNYLETISYIVSSRSCAVDINNPTRVFADALEYQVDYSKVASDINSSWKLVNNWGALIKYDLDVYRQIEQVATLSNGHTYATGGSGNLSIYDLMPSGPVNLGAIYGNIEPDGSLWRRNNVNNQAVNVVKQPLTGFDSNNRPIWGADVIVASNVPMNDVNSPVYYLNNTLGQSTNTGKVFFFNPNYAYDFGNGKKDLGLSYHLGGVNIGSSTFNWLSSKSTQRGYFGPYPTDGYFATNGNPNQGGSGSCLLNMQGKNLFWHVNDELGFYTQVCRTNHYNEDGLPIGHFGTDNQTVSYGGSTKFYAGNSFKTQLTPPINGKMYYFWCDESKHSGVGITEISNLSSITEQSISLSVSAAIKPVITDQSDLMFGVPFKSGGFYGGSGWTMNPVSGDDGSVQYPGWRVRTTVNAYKKEDDDIYIESDGNSGGNYKTANRTLGSNNTNNWTLSGQFKLNGNLNDNYSLDLIDAAGKDLIHIRTQYNRILLHGSFYQEQLFDANILSVAFVPFVVKNVNGLVSVSVGGLPFVNVNSYESGGNFSTPTTFQVRAGGAGDNKHTVLSVKGIRFTANKNVFSN